MAEETSAAAGSAYFDVHAALADDVRLPVKLVHGAKKVAPSLDPATGTPDLEAGALLDLPLWALKPLMQQGLAEARSASLHAWEPPRPMPDLSLDWHPQLQHRARRHWLCAAANFC